MGQIFTLLMDKSGRDDFCRFCAWVGDGLFYGNAMLTFARMANFCPAFCLLK